jgi:hypothetical protein
VAQAINAATGIDPGSGLPVNGLIQASAAGSVIMIRTIGAGGPVALSGSLAGFQDVLMDVLDFARMKAAISPNDEQLLDVVKNPNLLSTDGVTPQILKVTGWAASSLNTLLNRFFGSTQLTGLSSIPNLRRVFDAFAILTTCRISAAALLAATTNAPTPATVASLQSALRALYAASDWLNVIKPINDALRIQQRDALVAYILQQLGDRYASSLVMQQTTADAAAGATALTIAIAAGIQAGMTAQGSSVPPGAAVVSVAANTVTLSLGLSAGLPKGSNLVFAPAGASAMATADNLFEYFLIDVETQPAVETSRIRLALSSVQLFVERMLRNLEPQVQPTDIELSLWTWMKRYRVWQANREVFLWHENWLYPELRDDQSPIFQQIMSALLQSDITDDAAAEAYLDYLSNLELVAKLEPCGLYYVPATRDSDEASYVVARSAGAHRKYYFRELKNGSWTPWTEVKIDCEEVPITPVVWNGRLMLFWLKVSKATTTQATQASTTLPSGHSSSDPAAGLSLDDFASFGQTAAGAQGQGNVTVSAVLCWSEYYNGKWQPQKSSDVNRPAVIGTNFDTAGPNSFDPDRNLMTITPITFAAETNYGEPLTFVAQAVPSSALILAITSPLNHQLGGFVMYNTHSLPVRWEDLDFVNALLQGTSQFATFAVLAMPPDPGRTLQPAVPYTGGTTDGSFSISYWTLVNGPGVFPAIQTSLYQKNLFGLNLGQRTVDCAPNAAGWDAPFFFEDRRNVFYVTTSESYTYFFNTPSYGIVFNNYLPPKWANIPPLLINSPRPQWVITPFSLAGSGGDPAAVAKFVAQNGLIRAAIGTGTPVVYRGTALYPTGQALEQSLLKSVATPALKPTDKNES